MSSSASGFWDNLIPFKGGISGPQLAGWTPGPPAKSGLGCRLLADRMVPVENGIALAADIYLPKSPGRYPAVIAFSAYSKELQAAGAPTGSNETGSPPVFTDRGYAHLIVSRRGMGRSGGEFAPFFNDTDVADHARVIAWAAAQPWCDGQVVLFGTSYYGIGAPVTPGFDEVANPLLSFEMPIHEEVEFTGPVTINLVFSCNEIDSHVVARTGRVASDGSYHLLSIGTIRPACRRIDTARSTATEIALDIDRPEPLIPGEPVTLGFSLTPQPVVLRPGERLRLDLASRVDLLRSDVSHGHAQFDMPVPPYFARNTLHYGAQTYVELHRILAGRPSEGPPA